MLLFDLSKVNDATDVEQFIIKNDIPMLKVGLIEVNQRAPFCNFYKQLGLRYSVLIITSVAIK